MSAYWRTWRSVGASARLVACSSGAAIARVAADKPAKMVEAFIVFRYKVMEVGIGVVKRV